MSETYPPPRAGGMDDTPLPDCLPHVGTAVVLLDGRVGVVEHYQFYHPTQTSFPVRFGRQTSIWSMASLRHTNEILAKRQGALHNLDAARAEKKKAARTAPRRSAAAG